MHLLTNELSLLASPWLYIYYKSNYLWIFTFFFLIYVYIFQVCLFGCNSLKEYLLLFLTLVAVDDCLITRYVTGVWLILKISDYVLSFFILTTCLEICGPKCHHQMLMEPEGGIFPCFHNKTIHFQLLMSLITYFTKCRDSQRNL